MPDMLGGGQCSRNLLDVILLLASDDDNLEPKVDAVPHQLSEHAATFNIGKVESELDELQFLGLTVSNDGVRPLECSIA